MFGKTLFLSTVVVAQIASANCGQLLEDLRQMKKAQESVQSSLISNHEMMAASLESYSDALKQTSGKAHKAVSQNMARAVVSLRERGLKAQNIANQLSEKTEDLIQQAEKCLK